MPRDSQSIPPVFQIDVTSESSTQQPAANSQDQVVNLLERLVTSQERQNKLLEKMVKQQSAAQRARANEFAQWREGNPDLANDCRGAAESLSRVQASFLETLTAEALDGEDAMMDGGYMLSEFVDRFGPRLAHLNGVLQVLAQLGGDPVDP